MEGEIVEVGCELTKTGKRHSVFLKVELFKRGYEQAEKEVEALRQNLLGKKVLIYSIEEGGEKN